MDSRNKSSRTQKSGHPKTNQNLQFKWDATNYENHKYNLKTAKHNIDNAAPQTYVHLYYRPKKLQMELERFCEIQRSNKLLLDRLATVYKKGAWIDNKNDYEVKSLNTWKRQKEMIELANSNQTIYKRLLNAQSAYNQNKLEAQYLLNRKYEASIAKYPIDWRNVVDQKKLLKKDIRNKVISKRTGKHYSELDRGKRRRAREKSAREAEKAEKAVEDEARVKEEELHAKEERNKQTQKWKQAEDKWKVESKRWREAREERIRLAKERQEEEAELEKEDKMREEDKQKRWQEKRKREVEEWRRQKREEEEAEEREREALEEKEKLRRRVKMIEGRGRRTAKEKATEEDSEGVVPDNVGESVDESDAGDGESLGEGDGGEEVKSD